jgi:hypothetical protein
MNRIGPEDVHACGISGSAVGDRIVLTVTRSGDVDPPAQRTVEGMA